MAISTDPQVWIAVFIIIAYNSFFLRDNIFFRISLAIVLFSSIGHWIATSLFTINTMSIQKLLSPTPDLIQLVLLLFGVAALFRLTEKYGWFSRYPTAYLIGLGISVTAGPMAEMIRDQFLSVIQPFQTSFVDPFIVLIVLTTSLTYFLIRKMELKGIMGQAWSGITRIGRLLLFLGLGLVAADTVAGFFEYVYYGYEKILWELLGLG